MKKRMTILLVGLTTCLLWIVPGFARSAEIRGGLKAGVSITNLRGSDVTQEFLFDSPTDSRIGPIGGAFVEFGLTNNLAFQIEALYSTKGAKVSIPGDWEVEATAAYLEIPILAKLTIGTQGSVKPFVFLGPSLAIKLSDKFEAVDNGEAYEGNIEGLKSTDLGIAFGAGLEIGRNIITDIRYTLGMAKLITLEGQTYDVKNGALSIMIGYSF